MAFVTPSLKPRICADSKVTSINRDGWMVGCILKNRSRENGGREMIGAIWSPDNSYYLTGDAILNHINDRGIAVGTLYSQQGPPMAAIVWDRDHGLRRLNSLLPSDSPILVEASSINNKGEILVEANNSRDCRLLIPN